MDLTVVQGDIADQQADALVNAAGTSLRMGSGVAGALLAEAGNALERDARARGPIDLGEVAVTDAYDLDADYVVHAAAMSHAGPHRIATAESIREATHSALDAADALGCESIVIPLLGCGSGGFYTTDGAPIICEVIRAYEPDILNEARVIAYTDREFEILKEVVDTVRSSGE